jgi:hypothetical protein
MRSRLITPSGNGPEQVVALVPDVFFSVTVRNTVLRCGLDAIIVTTTDDLVHAASAPGVGLIILDITAVHDDASWSRISGIADSGLPVLAFGPHRDVEGLRRAKAAGVERVVANSLFHREMADLITRYVRSQGDEQTRNAGGTPDSLAW